MVSKYIIVKSIDNAIWKCGQRLRLNNNIISTFNSFAKSRNGKPTEQLIITDDKGNILLTEDGDKHHVYNPIELENKAYELNNNEPVHLNHNHPKRYGAWLPTCLSPSDVNRLFDTNENDEFIVKSMTCECGFTGMRMTIVRGDNFKKEDINKAKEIDFQLLDNLRSGLDFDAITLQQDIFNRLWSRNSKGLTPDSPEFIKVLKECNTKATVEALKYDGYYDDYKEAQNAFREVNCKLTIQFNPDNSWYDSDEEKKQIYY